MRDLTYPSIVLMARAGFKVLGLRFRITGTEHIPATGGAVIALNHVSYLDFVFGGLAAQPVGRLVRFMAKREVFDHRLSGPVMRSMHHIRVDRSEGLESYATAVDYLKAGELVGVFPEATISRAFELKDFKTGAVRMAAEAGVPVVPVIVWGSQRLLTKDHPKDLSRGKAISIAVGEPVVPTGDDAGGQTARLRATMADLLERTVHEYPQHEPGAWWVPARYGGSAPTLEEAKALDAAERRERARRRRRTTG